MYPTTIAEINLPVAMSKTLSVYTTVEDPGALSLSGVILESSHRAYLRRSQITFGRDNVERMLSEADIARYRLEINVRARHYGRHFYPSLKQLEQAKKYAAQPVAESFGPFIVAHYYGGGRHYWVTEYGAGDHAHQIRCLVQDVKGLKSIRSSIESLVELEQTAYVTRDASGKPSQEFVRKEGKWKPCPALEAIPGYRSYSQ